MITVCIMAKERSWVPVDIPVKLEDGTKTTERRHLELLPNCLKSLAKAIDTVDCPVEVSICDFGSDDWPLESWVYDVIPNAVITKTNRPFSRGAGRNIAAAAARYDTLLFLDADLVVPENLITRALASINSQTAYVPRWWIESTPDGDELRHIRNGHGACFGVTRQVMYAAGGWPPLIPWGCEDGQFFKAVKEIVDVDRSDLGGLVHQWHPPQREWKDRLRTDYETVPAGAD